MLKRFKQATLKSLKTAGVSQMVHNSRWRRDRLLILAYHGIAMDDEHLWDDSLFMSAEMFQRRLELIKKSQCTVLPLGEAVDRLYANDLPERSVAITFDDGMQDFYQAAFPLLQEFAFPVTVYLSTFYSEFNRPVFDVMCAYLLWKGRTQKLNLKHSTGSEEQIELRFAESRRFGIDRIQHFAREKNLSAEEKDGLTAGLAKQLNVDYDELLDRRAMHLLNPAEVKALSNEGVDFQLHTHRHCTPSVRELFLREIEQNREHIQAMTGHRSDHFCYPSGVYHDAFLPWLREVGVTSATTCDFGLASTKSDRLLLPRLVDVSSLSEIEFEGWLSGVSHALPRRHEVAQGMR
ncbi:MAG: polysaccharide deacetylase family protein [Acidobacteriota bacterium]